MQAALAMAFGSGFPRRFERRAIKTFELALVVVACVVLSAVLGKIVRRVALPLVQIAVGLVAALAIPAVAGVDVGSELFLMLFIAPLLFDEARSANRRELWSNKGAILSLAVGLVLMSVLVVGFCLNLIVPSIPLAAAFACAAALSPTDAAAVGALGSTVGLTGRQQLLLSGESLINDASGVVSFQFASAAVITGAFSVIDAGESFLVLFFGGIGLGAALGGVALGCMLLLRRFGYEDTVIHVLYEVLTPFAVYLAAEWLGVSGILAVVACGLVMADRMPRLVSPDAARRQAVSDNFWKVIVFLINGVVFVLLGMQLPRAVAPEFSENFPVPMLVIIVLAVTLLLYACRFAWIAVMELAHRARADGERPTVCASLKDALVMTLAGPKGAVTLSIIFTLPITMQDGSLFPERNLIILVTAGVILATLLAANFLLSLLAPKRLVSDEGALRDASIRVLEATLADLQHRLDSGEQPQYTPAMRLTVARYQTRLARVRAESESLGPVLDELSQKCLELQQTRADELQSAENGSDSLPVMKAVPYYATLRSIRASVGYVGSATTVGSRFHSMRGRLGLLYGRLSRGEEEYHDDAQTYYDTCIFAIELEHVALDYLRGVAKLGDGRKHAAEVLIASHEAALNSLWGRINYGQKVKQDDTMHLRLGVHDDLPEGVEPTFGEQYDQARRYADEVDASALTTELDHIRHLQEQGEISASIARQLRERVYALQASLED